VKKNKSLKRSAPFRPFLDFRLKMNANIPAAIIFSRPLFSSAAEFQPLGNIGWLSNTVARPWLDFGSGLLKFFILSLFFNIFYFHHLFLIIQEVL
jgi:hypothetical protein